MQPRPDAPARGVALMVAAMMLLATMDAVGKHLTATYPVAQILAVRFAMFLALALAVAAPRGIRRTIAGARPGLQLLRSAILAADSPGDATRAFLARLPRSSGGPAHA